MEFGETMRRRRMQQEIAAEKAHAVVIWKRADALASTAEMQISNPLFTATRLFSSHYCENLRRCLCINERKLYHIREGKSFIWGRVGLYHTFILDAIILVTIRLWLPYAYIVLLVPYVTLEKE